MRIHAKLFRTCRSAEGKNTHVFGCGPGGRRHLQPPPGGSHEGMSGKLLYTADLLCPGAGYCHSDDGERRQRNGLEGDAGGAGDPIHDAGILAKSA